VRRGFTLVEVAVALLLVGVVAYIVSSLALTLRGSQAQTQAQAEWTALVALAEAFDPAALPSCPSTRSVVLGDQTVQACKQVRTEGDSSFTRTVTTVVLQGGSGTSRLTLVDAVAAPPPPPPSPNLTNSTCQKGANNKLTIDWYNTGAAFSFKTLQVFWSGKGGGKNRLTEIQMPPGTSIYKDGKGVKSGATLSLNGTYSLPTNTPTRMKFIFSQNFSAGRTYSFTIVFNPNQSGSLSFSCSVRF